MGSEGGSKWKSAASGKAEGLGKEAGRVVAELRSLCLHVGEAEAEAAEALRDWSPVSEAGGGAGVAAGYAEAIVASLAFFCTQRLGSVRLFARLLLAWWLSPAEAATVSLFLLPGAFVVVELSRAAWPLHLRRRHVLLLHAAAGLFHGFVLRRYEPVCPLPPFWVNVLMAASLRALPPAYEALTGGKVGGLSRGAVLGGVVGGWVAVFAAAALLRPSAAGLTPAFLLWLALSGLLSAAGLQWRLWTARRPDAMRQLARLAPAAGLAAVLAIDYAAYLGVAKPAFPE